MANKPLKSIKFPGLPDTYTIEGLSEGAKVALLACFRHVAWTDEHGQDYYDALESAFNNVVDFYNIWEWDSRFTGAGKLTRTPARASEFVYEGTQKKGILYNTTLISGNNNRGFATLHGKAPMVTEDNVTLSEYYPIPVPATANKLTATITPNTQRLSPILFQYDPTNETPAPYSRIGSIAWHVGEVSVTFDASENLFLAFNCSVDSSFTRYTTDTEPEMHVLFERI